MNLGNCYLESFRLVSASQLDGTILTATRVVLYIKERKWDTSNICNILKSRNEN